METLQHSLTKLWPCRKLLFSPLHVPSDQKPWEVLSLGPSLKVVSISASFYFILPSSIKSGTVCGPVKWALEFCSLRSECDSLSSTQNFAQLHRVADTLNSKPLSYLLLKVDVHCVDIFQQQEPSNPSSVLLSLKLVGNSHFSAILTPRYAGGKLGTSWVSQ